LPTRSSSISQNTIRKIYKESFLTRYLDDLMSSSFREEVKAILFSILKQVQKKN